MAEMTHDEAVKLAKELAEIKGKREYRVVYEVAGDLDRYSSVTYRNRQDIERYMTHSIRPEVQSRYQHGPWEAETAKEKGGDAKLINQVLSRSSGPQIQDILFRRVIITRLAVAAMALSGMFPALPQINPHPGVARWRAYQDPREARSNRGRGAATLGQSFQCLPLHSAGPWEA